MLWKLPHKVSDNLFTFTSSKLLVVLTCKKKRIAQNATCKVTKHVEIHVFCDVKDLKELARSLNILGDVDQIKYRPMYENKNTKEK